MTDLHKAYQALKKRNPLAAALLTSRRIARDHEAGLEMIERACDPDEDKEWRVQGERSNKDDAEN